MPYFIIEDFRSGLDSRRLPVLSVPGSLLELTNGHINRGGEVEKRFAFVSQMTFPNTTFGLVAVGGTLFTFGSTAGVTLPAGAPANMVYQRLIHPTGLAMNKIIHATAFAGKPYAVAQFTDGSIFHFYNGTRHLEFVDARARASFTITAGSAGGVSATASLTVTGGINAQSDRIMYIRAGTLPILNSPVQHNGSNSGTATAIAAAINSFAGNPDFTATAAGAVLTITAVTPGSAYNGMALNTSLLGGFTIGSVVNVAGGIDNAVGALSVDGINIIGQKILHNGNNAQTATAIANEINEYQSAPDYRASTDGATVYVIIQQEGTANNGKILTIGVTGNVTTTPAATATFAGGVALVTTPAGSETYLPSEYTKPAKSKMYSTAGSLLHFSEIEDPLDINNVTNAGFINLSTNAEGSERLTAIANYQSNLAIFSERTVQIWFVDVDPSLNQQLQVLNNTGAIAPHSIQEIGDSDVLYLSESGIRSLRARYASNAAFSTDIGNPIDDIMLAEISTNRLNARAAKAVLEPRDGRYMMAIGLKVYVFSFFPASKVSAWSVYELPFTIGSWAIIGRRLYCRSEEGGLYLLGGMSGKEYDTSPVTMFIPFVSAGTPATSKEFHGIDVALQGLWTVAIATDPNDMTALQTVATVEETTMAKGHVAFEARSTHLGIKLNTSEDGAAKVGAIFVHYRGGSQG
jgi:hypothetical protein